MEQLPLRSDFSPSVVAHAEMARICMNAVVTRALVVDVADELIGVRFGSRAPRMKM
jgi:hypothetical protein